MFLAWLFLAIWSVTFLINITELRLWWKAYDFPLSESFHMNFIFDIFNDVPIDLEWIWNWSFIGQQPDQAKDHWWLIKASNDSYLDALAIHNVSFTPLYKGVKTWKILRDSQQFKSVKPLLKLFCIKSSLRISYQSSYLRNSRVLIVCIWFVLWTPLIVY